GEPAEETDDDVLHRSEDAYGPDDRHDRKHHDDQGCDGGHDPDHDLEQDPCGHRENQDGQRPTTEVSGCFAHAHSVAERYKSTGGLVGTYRSRPGNATEDITQLGQ